MSQYIGVDIGTTNTKVACYDANAGHLVAGRKAPSSVTDDQWGGRREAFAVVERVRGLLRELLDDPAVEVSEVAGLSVGSVGEEVVPTDDLGKPVGPILVWYANHGHEAKAALSGGEFAAIDPTFSIFKLAWFAAHEPDVLEQAATFTSLADFVALQLTDGVGDGAFMNTSHASRTGLLDVRGRRLDETPIRELGIGNIALPRLVRSGTVVGRCGEPALIGTPVVAGGHDHFCGAFGADVRSAGDVYVSAGTNEAQFMVTTDVPDKAAGVDVGLYVVDDLVYVHRGTPSGRYFQAWRDVLFSSATDDQMWEQTEPYLSIAPPAHFDVDAGTVDFPPLSALAEPGPMMASLQAGLAAHARAVTDELERVTGRTASTIRLAGVASRSSAWRAMRETYMGPKASFVSEPEATALGVARLAEHGVTSQDKEA